MIKWPSSITHITSLHEETNNLITLLQHENFIASTKESNKFIEKSNRQIIAFDHLGNVSSIVDPKFNTVSGDNTKN